MKNGERLIQLLYISGNRIGNFTFKYVSDTEGRFYGFNMEDGTITTVNTTITVGSARTPRDNVSEI